MVHLPVYTNLVQFTHVPWITNILSLCRVIKRCAETSKHYVFNIVAFTKIVYIEISLECFWYILSYSSKYIVHILKNLFIEYFYFLKMY